jgi:hypothetical protein
MSATTITLPLKLYRNGTADDLQKQVAREISLLPEARPDRIIDAAISIERLRGQADVLAYLEKEFYEIVHWGVEQGWTMQQTLLAQYDTVAGLATQHPDDTGGSHLNDGKRAYNDGRREVLAHVTGELRRSDYFPGNTKS